MKITFVLPAVSFGGGTRVLAIYADFLRRRGHTVTAVLPPPAPRTLRDHLRAWRRGRALPRRPEGGIPPSHFDGLGIDLRLSAQPGQVAPHDVPDADVVIATWWETAEWVLALPPSKGTKVYFVQHHEVFEYLPVDRVRRTYTAPLHRIAVAQWLVDLLADEYGDSSVDLVSNAVDHAVFHAPPREKQARPTVGFLDALADFKGVDVVATALHELRQRLPGLRMLSFGTARNEVLRDLHPEIEFTLEPPQEGIRALYASCDVWLTASRSEGFNLPAMEAMACRTPVVSTKTGWPLEAIVDGRNGYLVEVDDAHALADRAHRVLTAPSAEWQRLSQQAFDTVAGLDWDRSAAQFEAALVRVRQKQPA